MQYNMKKQLLLLSTMILSTAWLTGHADAAPQTVSFRNGTNGYNGTFDRSISPTADNQITGSSVKVLLSRWW
jgi:hypothetical protein